MINDVVNNGIQSATLNGTSSSKEAIETPTVEAVKADVLLETEQKQEPQKLETAVSSLNDYVQNIQRTLSFSIEEDTGITVVRVFDSETEELIRQIPAEETIKLAASIEENISNLLFQERA